MKSVLSTIAYMYCAIIFCAASNAAEKNFVLISENGSEHLCDRDALAAHSDYWDRMVTGGMREAEEGRGKLSLSQPAVEMLVNFINYKYKTLAQTTSIEIYLELLYFADYSCDEVLKGELQLVSIKFGDDIKERDAVGYLATAVAHADENFVGEILRSISDVEVGEELSSAILTYVREREPLVIASLIRIKRSTLFSQLCKIDHILFMATGLNYSQFFINQHRKIPRYTNELSKNF